MPTPHNRNLWGVTASHRPCFVRGSKTTGDSARDIAICIGRAFCPPRTPFSRFCRLPTRSGARDRRRLVPLVGQCNGRALCAPHKHLLRALRRGRESAPSPRALLLARRARACDPSLAVGRCSPGGRVLELKYKRRRTRCCGHRRSCPHARNGAMAGSANAQAHVCARHARTGAQARAEAIPGEVLPACCGNLGTADAVSPRLAPAVSG